ncbi:MAG: hypothetical protein NT051_06750, partial [Candidatus Micrarchaeota archaeon]|nr:hypothetical protein [Candidatus Micrarchaeota archaeon]
ILHKSGFPMRAQAGIELTAIFGIFLIIILFYSVAASGMLSHISVQQNYDEAYKTVQALARAADSVYAQGEGARQSVQAVIPSNADLNSSYIGGADAKANAISLRIQGTDVFITTRAPLAGAFPRSSGEHLFQVISHGSYVSINENIAEPVPSSINAKVRAGAMRESVLQIHITSSEGAEVNVTSPWSNPSINLSISPSHFLTYGDASVPIYLNFSTGAQARGLYYSTLQVAVYDRGNPQVGETITVPVTLEVYAG